MANIPFFLKPSVPWVVSIEVSVSGTVLVRLGVGPVPAKIGDEGRSGWLTCRQIALIMSLKKNRSSLRPDVRGN